MPTISLALVASTGVGAGVGVREMGVGVGVGGTCVGVAVAGTGVGVAVDGAHPIAINRTNPTPSSVRSDLVSNIVVSFLLPAVSRATGITAA